METIIWIKIYRKKYIAYNSKFKLIIKMINSTTYDTHK